MSPKPTLLSIKIVTNFAKSILFVAMINIFFFYSCNFDQWSLEYRLWVDILQDDFLGFHYFIPSDWKFICISHYQLFDRSIDEKSLRDRVSTITALRVSTRECFQVELQSPTGSQKGTQLRLLLKPKWKPRGYTFNSDNKSKLR